jgi:hypothetical protein
VLKIAALIAVVVLFACPAPVEAHGHWHVDWCCDGPQVYYAHPHHWWTNDGRKFDWGSLSTRSSVSHRRPKCEGLHLVYVMRHPLVKPRSLRGLSGCSLWKADQRYHASRGRLRPTWRSVLFGD